MRSLKRAILSALVMAAAFTLPTLVHAQVAEPEKVAFDTVDQVKIQGLFYPSAKLKKAPVVMLLHKIGGNSTQDGWDKLALDLQKAGYAVLIFDFRGHGNSTSVGSTFWTDNQINTNMYNRGVNPQKLPETISIKDFKTAYYPQLVNDIMAAKVYLDKRNDGGDCNSSNLIVIGAEDGATLGALWAYSEQLRFRVTQLVQPNILLPPQYVKDPTSSGSQIAACIWLSIAPQIGNTGTPIREWTRVVGGDKNVPMAFVYGAKNTNDASNGKTLAGIAKGGKDAGKWTGDQGIKDSDLKGHGLLGDKGRDWIVNTYLKKLMDEKAMPVWEAKESKKAAFVWEFPGKQGILSKIPEEDQLRRAPTDILFKP